MAKRCTNLPQFQMSAIQNSYRDGKNPCVLNDFTDGAVENPEGS